MLPRHIGFSAFALMCVLPFPAFANRIISAKISVDGKTVLIASDADNGDAPMAAVWRRFSTMEFKLAEGQPPVTPDDDDPLHATLKGNVEISLNDGGSHVAKVGVLHLFRSDEKSGWSVFPADVEITAKLAGYETIPPWSPTIPAKPERDEGKAVDNQFYLQIAGLVGGAVLIVAILVFVMMRKRKR